MDYRIKKELLCNLLNTELNIEQCYETLKKIGDIKLNYYDYMITEPFSYNNELLRLPKADYDLCCALLTMLLHKGFNNNSINLQNYYGDLRRILQRMITLL